MLKNLETFCVSSQADEVSFIDRLAKENRWTKTFAHHAYHEYLRFIYLAYTSDSAVTPSERIDKVWHLHLCYTRSYWVDLCRNTLGKEIHHNPSKGGPNEEKKHLRQYEETLKLYKAVFKIAPPEDVWPSPSNNGTSGRKTRAENPVNAYSIPKKWVHWTCLASLSLAFLTGCEKTIEKALEGDPGSIAIVGAIGLIGLCILWKIARSSRGGGGGGYGCGTGCGSDCGSGCGGD